MRVFKKVLLVLCICMLAACGKEEQKDIQLTDAMSYIENNYIDTFTTEVNDSDFYTMFELDPSQIKQQVYYQAFLDVKCDEIALIQVSDEDLVEQVKTVLQTRLEAITNEFDGYIEAQKNIASQGIIFSRGTYVFMIVHEDAVAIQDYLIHELEN
ncbi:MAG: DUF4358 domain-containing protein [Erysipelotrichaceae bacterium]|nr:DUF4358 domain-containing protein [Erysipelotrichaceae bacterium]MBR3693297.1 DUF4358 domain-containing protein [Erysipelotrichales bacterium]